VNHRIVVRAGLTFAWVGFWLGGLMLPAAQACPFCSAQGTTFSGEVSTAHFIIVGTIQKSEHDPADFSKGKTELKIDAVIKPHPYLNGKTSITIPRYIPGDPQGQPLKMLVFCELHTPILYTLASAITGPALLCDARFTQLDAYRGEQLAADSRLATYLQGAFRVRELAVTERLKYFLQYLDDPELQISTDALNEFASANYGDVRPVAEKASADQLLMWIKNPGTPQSRLGLYGLLLGHCGNAAHAKELRQILDRNDSGLSGGLDGLIAAYVMLEPEAGYNYLLQLLKDPKIDQSVRYAVLKVFRFFWDYRSDLVAKPKILEGMKRIVAMPEMADLAIDDLRKWQCWDQAGLVLSLIQQPAHMKEAMNRRAILKFAIACPTQLTEAKAYVERVRKEDPDRVKYVEQALQDEITPLPPQPNPNNPTGEGTSPMVPGPNGSAGS